MVKRAWVNGIMYLCPRENLSPVSGNKGTENGRRRKYKEHRDSIKESILRR